MSDLWQNRIVKHEDVDPATLIPHPLNFRKHPPQHDAKLVGLLKTIGWVDEIVANVTTGHMLNGHWRREKALEHHEPTVPVKWVRLSEEEELQMLAAFDYTTSLAELDGAALADLLARVDMTPVEDDGVRDLLAQLAAEAANGILAQDEAGNGGAGQAQEAARATLAERFLVPPFSVLDARQGYWQERKRAWIALGIQSELGRGENALDMSATMAGITDEAERAACSTQRRESPRHGGGKDMAMHDSANFPTPLARKRSYDRKGKA